MIYCDNKSTISMAENQVFHRRTKHIELHYLFIRGQIISSTIEVAFCLTKDQVADGLMETHIFYEVSRRSWYDQVCFKGKC